MGRRMYGTTIAVALLGLSLFLGPVAVAGQTQYGKEAPRFDQVMMLRVASASADASPKNPAEECSIYGQAVLLNVVSDHARWYRSGDSEAVQDSIDAAQGSNRWCKWIKSSSAQAAIDGLANVLVAVDERPFAKLEQAIRRARCNAVRRGLGAYPETSLTRKQLRKVIVDAVGGKCR